MNKIILKEIITDFENYSKNLLKTSSEKVDADLYRFKKYIDNTAIIKNILDDCFLDSMVNYEDYFFTKLGNMSFRVSLNEKDHMKAIYDYITMILENNIAVFNVATLYPCESRNVDEILRKFVLDIIFPLINFISNSLTKKLMQYDDIYPIVTLNANNSPVYFHSTGNQYVKYEQNNDLVEINNLINNIIDLINDEKELDNNELLDDVKLVQETINQNDINKNRIASTLKRITNAIKNITSTTAQALLLKESIESLITMVSEIIK